MDCLSRKKKNKLIEITTGNLQTYTLFTPPQEYRVDHRSCKSYVLTLTTSDVEKVNEKVKQLRKERGDIQIVKVYKDKK